jgi:hypothetical protein
VRDDAAGLVVAAAGAVATALLTLRVCREIHKTRLAEHRALTVHAALAAGPGRRGLLLVGGSGRGKTTLAMAMAQRGGWLVSTDVTALVVDPAGGLTGVGSPVAHRIGAGAMRMLLTGAGQPRVRLLREETRQFDDGPPTMKSWVTAAEAQALLGVAATASAPVRSLVLLAGSVELAAGFADAEAAERSVRAELRLTDPLYGEPWLAEPAEAQPPPPEIDNTVAALLALPRVRLAWDPTRHDVETVLARLGCELDMLAGQS